MADRGPTGKSSLIEIEKVSFVEHFHGENRELNVFRLLKLLGSMVGLTNWKNFLQAIVIVSHCTAFVCGVGLRFLSKKKQKTAGQILQPLGAVHGQTAARNLVTGSEGNGKAAFQYFHFCLTWDFC